MHYFYCMHDEHRRLSRNFDAVQQASLVLVSPPVHSTEHRQLPARYFSSIFR